MKESRLFQIIYFILEKGHVTAPELAEKFEVSVVDSTFEREALTKLSALFNINSENLVKVDFGRWGSKPQDNMKFERLKKAVIAHKAVTVVYVNSLNNLYFSSCVKHTNQLVGIAMMDCFFLSRLSRRVV